ncbi:hypothetical protein [Pararhizobium sp. PWRC1-1]|uniref:hypothetical protein n=1 Tax=Pararhizobium sp. PWRC1-1 TaxID=2804566 RepID=UPI003CE96C4D
MSTIDRPPHNISPSGQEPIAAKISAISQGKGNSAGVVGLSAIIQHADPASVPFCVGDEVYGVASGSDPFLEGAVYDLDSNRLARKPHGLNPIQSADLAASAVVAWLVLFECLELPIDIDDQPILIDVSDTPTGTMVAKLLQAVTKARLILFQRSTPRSNSLVRPGMDSVLCSVNDLYEGVKTGRTKLPRFVVLASRDASDLGALKASDIATFYQSQEGLGALRLVNIVWAEFQHWKLITDSRYSIADVLTEIALLVDVGRLDLSNQST